MVSKGDIKKDMEVHASDGQLIGRVDSVDGDRIKITRQGSPDNQHHYADLSDVTRVDGAVYLNKNHGELDAAGKAGAAAGPASPLPPIRNPAVDGAAPRRNYMLPWVLGGLLLLLLLAGLSQCDRDDDRAGPDPAAVETPRVVGAPLRQGSLADDVDRFLAGTDGTPRTFTIDTINFDSGTAALREGDRSDLDDLARVLAAYPGARAAVVGFADARGPSAMNSDLGAERARAVVAALASRGIDLKRVDARTGGEANPAATNTNAPGRVENRRTEFVIIDR